MSSRFKTPDKMNFDRDTRVPISSRMNASSRELLKKASKKRKVSLAALIEKVLEDYVEYLVEEKFISK